MYMNKAFPFKAVNPFFDPFKGRAAGSGPGEATAPRRALGFTLANQYALVMAAINPTRFHFVGVQKRGCIPCRNMFANKIHSIPVSK